MVRSPVTYSCGASCRYISNYYHVFTEASGGNMDIEDVLFMVVGWRSSIMRLLATGGFGCVNVDI